MLYAIYVSGALVLLLENNRAFLTLHNSDAIIMLFSVDLNKL